MTSLVGRLRSAIEERRALAEAASGDTWRALRMTDVGYFVGDEHGRAVARLWVEMDELTEGPQPVGGNPLDTSKHIAANDPSTVIARCKADLWILAELADPGHCEDCTDGGDSAGTVHECPVDGVKRTVIRLLAEGYGITEDAPPE